MAPVLLLTGPAGAGKTAVADAWARTQNRPTIHLSLDDVREMVKSGYRNPEYGITLQLIYQLMQAWTSRPEAAVFDNSTASPAEAAAWLDVVMAR